ncbi:hypothetical protein OS493_006370 [Desmophyllum pertusum]|uniref:Uncharacterized protein n=1 Tax=Desmophyllum pertusum TaxID=174260 RepID=A0A9X0A4S3_9CNID|nr:hypothetical protein OS493_006370 [Desmophyllum pertusum]
MASREPIIDDLELLYQPLVGMEFSGTYNGVFTMPQTGNLRDVLKIETDPLATTLSGITNHVLKNYGTRIWKGITGPEDGRRYHDYWLWVEPGFSKVLLKGSSYDFKISQCTPFECGGGTFTHGVSIQVTQIKVSSYGSSYKKRSSVEREDYPVPDISQLNIF